VKLGFGGRLSVMRESVIAPGISLTWLRRDLPPLAISANPGSDELDVRNLEVKTSAWRALVGKNFGPVALAAGFGQDTYETTALADVTVHVPGTSATGTITGLTAGQRMHRDNAFGSIAVNVATLSFVGEYGRSSGDRLATFNTFGADRADDPREYLSVGVRFRW
jgi:hypothetical protein